MARGWFGFMPLLPFSIYVEVALFCGVATHLSLLRLTKSLNVILRHLLYRNITVQGTSAKKLVHSLAKNPLLPLIVETLLFEDVSAHVDLEEWTHVLPQLVNLWCLGIAPNIPLPQQAIPHITFRLTCFQAVCSVAGAWCDFVASQSTLDEIYLDSFFWGGRACFKGHPQNLVNFAAVHSLVDIWVFTGVPLDTHVFAPSDLAKLAASPSRLSTIRISALDFLAVLEAAPALLTTLCHLVVDEDLSWSNFTLATGHDLSSSSAARPTKTGRGGGPCTSLTLSAFPPSSPPIVAPGDCVLFRFYASDGCAFWYRWGQDTETVSYVIRQMELHPETTSEWFHLSLTSSLVLQDAQQDQKKRSRESHARPHEQIVSSFQHSERVQSRCAEEELRPEPCAQDSTKAMNSSHNSVTNTQWNNWVDQLMAAADEPDVEQPAGEETDKEQWAAEEEERERAWDRAVILCVEGMREPDRPSTWGALCPAGCNVHCELSRILEILGSNTRGFD
ncbi:hypothetical protein B0H14DRAFT_2653183 [Mycena olivaceomarginata]|nr:hypothetical protein B0H14DRAFT_2653183 [Mycena olivaceomarginata]